MKKIKYVGTGVHELIDSLRPTFKLLSPEELIRIGFASGEAWGIAKAARVAKATHKHEWAKLSDNPYVFCKVCGCAGPKQ